MASNPLLDSIFDESGRPSTQYRKITLNVNGVVQVVMVPLDDGNVEEPTPTSSNPGSDNPQQQARGTKRSYTASDILFGKNKAPNEKEQNTQPARITQNIAPQPASHVIKHTRSDASASHHRASPLASSQQRIRHNPLSTSVASTITGASSHNGTLVGNAITPARTHAGFTKTPTPPIAVCNAGVLPTPSIAVSNAGVLQSSQNMASFAQFQLPNNLFNIQQMTRNSLPTPLTQQVTIVPPQPAQLPKPTVIAPVGLPNNTATAGFPQQTILSAQQNAVVIPTGGVYSGNNLLMPSVGVNSTAPMQAAMVQMSAQQYMQISNQTTMINAPQQPAFVQHAPQPTMMPPVTPNLAQRTSIVTQSSYQPSIAAQQQRIMIPVNSNIPQQTMMIPLAAANTAQQTGIVTTTAINTNQQAMMIHTTSAGTLQHSPVIPITQACTRPQVTLPTTNNSTPNGTPHQQLLLQTTQTSANGTQPTNSVISLQNGMHLPVMMPTSQALQISRSSLNIPGSILTITPNSTAPIMSVTQAEKSLTLTVPLQTAANAVQVATTKPSTIPVSSAASAPTPIVISPTTDSLSMVKPMTSSSLVPVATKQSNHPASTASHLSGMKTANENNSRQQSKSVDISSSTITKKNPLPTIEKENTDLRYIKILPRMPSAEKTAPLCSVRLERVEKDDNNIDEDRLGEITTDVKSASKPTQKQTSPKGLQKKIPKRALKETILLSKSKSKKLNVNSLDYRSAEVNISKKRVGKSKYLSDVEKVVCAPETITSSPKVLGKETSWCAKSACTTNNFRVTKTVMKNKRKKTIIVDAKIKPCSVVLERVNMHGKKSVKMWDILPELYPDIFDPEDS